MIASKNRRRGGQAIFALAAAGLITMPVRADTPKPFTPKLDVVSVIDADRDVVATSTVATPEPETVDAVLTTPEPAYEAVGEGEASYYGHELAGNRTASGERFDPQALTAAHRTLPLGSKLRVTNKANGKSVIVRVNDRGPFAKRRVIDMSLAAAHKLSMVRAGKATVRMELLR
jgi:rare lipoprotein A